MRVVLASILVLALLVSGCAKPAGTTTPPVTSTPEASPTPDATPEPTPTPTTVPTPQPTNTTPASTPAPPVPTPPGTFWLNVTHDYATAGETKTFTIPNNTVQLEVVIDFQPGTTLTGYACAGPMHAVVKRPDGSTHADAFAAPSTGTGDPSNVHCGVTMAGTATGGAVVPGDWTVEFSGQGTGTGTIRVRPVPA
ncbi:MAG TPA: hypothetical protein VM370_10695 [Candidatus Thermoplasmatota archaeon]|nr:hypothetical protein [Candidatus Thermoplasmatota archaeon]